MTPTARPWLIAGIATLATVALAAGVIIGSHLGAQNTVPPAAVPDTATGSSQAATLATDFAELQTRLHAVAGIAVSAVGPRQEPMILGNWQSGPAWSTIKVPMIIAALRQANSPEVTDAMTATLTESDNAAAESIWESLGDPVTAAHKVEAVLRQTGDPTIVQSRRVRPEFSASGQTDWPLTDQVRFTSLAVCNSANAPVFELMGRVEPDQKWGIGTVPGSRFKGGWGPSPTGGYLVRQIGVLATPNGMIAVALAALPDSGSFGDGTAALTVMADWLTARLGVLPVGRCAP